MKREAIKLGSVYLLRDGLRAKVVGQTVYRSKRLWVVNYPEWCWLFAKEQLRKLEKRVAGLGAET